MPINFERTICCNLDETISREWLITNGLGGYATGTVAGTLTRMQQGLLVAALPEGLRLLLAKIDEEVVFDHRTYYLGTNEYRDGTLNPAGFVHLEAFRLEEGFPVFSYRLGGLTGITLEKRIWMNPGQNTVYIQYSVSRTSTTQNEEEATEGWRTGRRSSGYLRSLQEPEEYSLALTLLPLVAHRKLSQINRRGQDGQFQVHVYQQEGELHDGEPEPLPLPPGVAGCTITDCADGIPLHLLAVGQSACSTKFIPTGVWYWNFLRRHDQAAGCPAVDDLYLPGVIRARLLLGAENALTIIATADELTLQPLHVKQLNRQYESALDYQRSLLLTPGYFGEGGASVQSLPVLPFTTTSRSSIRDEEFLKLLSQAGNRFGRKNSACASQG